MGDVGPGFTSGYLSSKTLFWGGIGCQALPFEKPTLGKSTSFDISFTQNAEVEINCLQIV